MSSGGHRGVTRRSAFRRAAILRATVSALRKDPDASVAAIATEAGVGRVTLCGHFKTRPELIEAALIDGLDRGETVLRQVDLGGDARDAFSRLIASSWLLATTHVVMHGAADEISAGRLTPDDAQRFIDTTLQAAFGSTAQR